MSEEKNPLNAYNQFESIRSAVDQLETIHIYELNARQYGDADTPSLKNHIADLDKQIYEYELQLAELQAYVENLEKANKILLGANNALIEANNEAAKSHQLVQNQVESLIASYDKLPRVVKKFYGVK